MLTHAGFKCQRNVVHLCILVPFWFYYRSVFIFWFHFGSMLVLFWFHFGSILVPFRFHFGSSLVPFWFYFGSILVPFWFHFGSISVHVGSILVPCWFHFGSTLVPFWFSVGSILVPFWFYFSILREFVFNSRHPDLRRVLGRVGIWKVHGDPREQACGLYISVAHHVVHCIMLYVISHCMTSHRIASHCVTACCAIPYSSSAAPGLQAAQARVFSRLVCMHKFLSHCSSYF